MHPKQLKFAFLIMCAAWSLMITPANSAKAAQTTLTQTDPAQTDPAPPFPAGQSDSIGFQKVWLEILRASGINFTFVDAPKARKRRMFVNGTIVLDCCAAPLWRVRPEEIEAQRWSDTFYTTREHFLFLAGQEYPVTTPQDLNKLRVATVRGFEYQDSQHFGMIVTGRNIEDTFRLLQAGRADIGIVSNIDYYLLSEKMPGAFKLGPVRVEAPQKIRVHHSAEHLLPAINTAIAQLQSQGRIRAILEGQPLE